VIGLFSFIPFFPIIQSTIISLLPISSVLAEPSDIVTHSSGQLIILKVHKTYIDIITSHCVVEGLGS
jgi:hypothetical protein